MTGRSPALRAIEIFCCSGGMSEGFRRAGIEFAQAFDRDDDACDSYERNLGHRPIQIDAVDLLRLAESGWSPGPLDLLVADPPCTPWSRAGKRLGVDDERDMLGTTVGIIRRLRPRVFLIGNVPGLDDSTNLPTVQRVIGGLARDGYCVADFARLDAADFGVPQHRVRPFWFGHLDGPCLSWPPRTHGSPEECALPTLPGMARLLRWVTVREALAHLPPDELGTPVRLRWRESNGTRARRSSSLPRASDVDAPASVVTTRENGDGNIVVPMRSTARRKVNHRPSEADEPAKTLTRNTHSDGALLVNHKHPPILLDSPSPTLVAAHPGGTTLLIQERSDGSIRDSVFDEPARTVTAAARDNAKTLLVHPRHPMSSHDAPARVITGSDGGGSKGARCATWPWDVPATTIAVDDRIPPPRTSSRIGLDPFASRSGEALGARRRDPSGIPGGMGLFRQDQARSLESARASNAARARRGGREIDRQVVRTDRTDAGCWRCSVIVAANTRGESAVAA